MTDLLEQVYARIDAANAEDPNVEIVDAKNVPKELVYGQRMTARLEVFAPQASEAVKIAARAQHIRRWEVPRSDYPMDRVGYLRWRRSLYDRHAEIAADICIGLGYGRETIDKVQKLLRKKGIKSDPEVQLLEDVICLVFLEHYFAAFAAKHAEAKVIDILQKTWRKMSDAGHAAALALPLAEREQSLVARALAT